MKTLTKKHSVLSKAGRSFFPGWVMLGFSAAAQFLSAPGQSYSVSAFKKPMQATLNVSETSFSFAYGLATIVSGIVLPFTGRLIDRFGSRVVLPVVASLLAISCVFMSTINNLVLLNIGFALIRVLGQGAMWLLGTWIVGEWFSRKRGFATAISGLGSSLSVMVFPILNLYLIKNFGWQTTWKILGAIVAATVIVPAVLFLRSRPEDIGLYPDGIDPHDDQKASEPRVIRSQVTPTTDAWSLGEVLRDATFWKLLSTGVCTGLIGTGLVFHQETILAEMGISKDLSMWLISFQATVGTVAAIWAGRLTDRIPAERLLAIAMAMLSFSVLLIYFKLHWGFAFGFAVLNGLHGSIIRTAGTVVWINYYGRQNQGVIRGAAMSAMILAAAAGPLPLAIANDRLGSYGPALIGFVLLPLLSGVLVLTAKQPSRQT